MSEISGARKRRGMAPSSITRIINRLTVLEGKADQPTTFDIAQDMTKKLDELDKEFRKHNLQFVDLIPDEDHDALSKAQDDLDSHDDILADVNVCLKRLIATCTNLADSPKRKSLTRQLSHLEKYVKSILDEV